MQQECLFRGYIWTIRLWSNAKSYELTGNVHDLFPGLSCFAKINRFLSQQYLAMDLTI